ncbi:MAG: aspartate aminotransferase family protein [bacterium]|nr:aspartate aminotransferase family protein [bacterium]
MASTTLAVSFFNRIGEKPMGIMELKARAEKVLMPAYLRYHPDYPLWVARAEGAYLYDQEGRRYVDAFGEVCTASVGHCHPEVVAALREQIGQVWHVPSLYYSEPIVAAAEALVAVMHVPDCQVFWVNSGTEATEFAAQLATLSTGRSNFLCFRGSFHGRTRFSASVTVQGAWRKRVGVTLVPGVYPVPTPYAYREKPEGLNEDTYFNWILAEIDRTIEHACGGQLAGMFIEPMLGNGGVIYGPKWFYDGLVDRVHKAGGLVIADEVQTGVGRTGTWWGSSDWSVQPDIWDMAKGLGNGFPVGAVVARPEVAAAFNGTAHFSTYGGNPLAMVVVKKVLEIVGRSETLANIERQGARFLGTLRNLKRDHRLIGDVRGTGLMLGVELVEDKNKTPASPATMAAVMDGCRNKGVLLGKGGICGNVIRIKPPYCTSDEDTVTIMKVFDKVLTEVERATA